jgi:hypothetical protein
VADTGEVVNMEENWNSCSLDIIGRAVRDTKQSRAASRRRARRPPRMHARG